MHEIRRITSNPKCHITDVHYRTCDQVDEERLTDWFLDKVRDAVADRIPMRKKGALPAYVFFSVDARLGTKCVIWTRNNTSIVLELLDNVLYEHDSWLMESVSEKIPHRKRPGPMSMIEFDRKSTAEEILEQLDAWMPVVPA